MKTAKQLLILIVIIATLISIRPHFGYIPENTLTFDQQILSDIVKLGQTHRVNIVVKNFMNITITDIKISLNISTNSILSFNSSLLGNLENEKITLNETILSSSENGFTAYPIIAGYMTSNYFEFNISHVENGTKFLFHYDIESNEEGNQLIPRADMVYYDDWNDKKELRSTAQTRISFEPIITERDPYLPIWDEGAEMKAGWAWIMIGIAPIAAAIVTSMIVNIRIRKK